MNRRSLLLSAIAAMLPLPAIAAPRTLALRLGLSEKWRVIAAPKGTCFLPASFVHAVDTDADRCFMLNGDGFGPLRKVKYAAYVPGCKHVFAGEVCGNRWKIVGEFV